MTKLSRRSFLQTTSALALTAPNFVSAAFFWSRKKKVAANSRIVLGFIGVGKQGGGLLGGFLNSKDTQVVAVCDVDTTRREFRQKVVNDHYAKAKDVTAYKGCD